MSTWEIGRRYDYYGTPIVCVARYFDGALEMVDLAFVRTAQAPGGEAAMSESFTRTALALAPCVRPRVTETLGGVTRCDLCSHDGGVERRPLVVANAGLFVGLPCCPLCGAPPDPPESMREALAQAAAAAERRAKAGPFHAPACTHLPRLP